MGERLSRLHHFGDPGIQYADLGPRQTTSADPILAGIQLDQLADLFKSKARRLCRTYKAQAADIFIPIPPDAAGPIRYAQKAPPLVITDRFHAYIRRAGQT